MAVVPAAMCQFSMRYQWGSMFKGEEETSTPVHRYSKHKSSVTNDGKDILSDSSQKIFEKVLPKTTKCNDTLMVNISSDPVDLSIKRRQHKFKVFSDITNFEKVIHSRNVQEKPKGKCAKPTEKKISSERRLAANARERKRMVLLNDGFDRLRSVLPGLGPSSQLSKYETLQLAQEYIRELRQLLK